MALAIVLATAGSVDARMVRRRDPPVVEACRSRKDWPEVARCLDKLGSFTIERSLARARLVRVWIDDPDAVGAEMKTDAGVYLFVQQKDASWRIGGMFARRMNDTVLALAAVTVDRHVGYRLDVGTLQRTPLSLDAAPPVDASIRTLTSLYCYGKDYGCIEVQTSCEVMSRGKALFAFHGTVRLEGGDVVVQGDQSLAGSVCASTPRFSLGWAAQDD